MPIKIKDLSDDEMLFHGSPGCPGCGAYLGLKLALKILGPRTMVVNSTGCVTACTMFGNTKVPFFHPLFNNVGAIAGGIDVGLEVQGKREGVTVLVYSGDGGTADIGFQALSGAVERGHDFVYICYDNESYMNTGGQRSGTTPFAASTSTTPAGKNSKGEPRSFARRKDMVEIVNAHGAPYVASASIGYPFDYMEKVIKASSIEGPTYIHLHATCPTGWGVDSKHTVEVARLAVQCGLVVLKEIENGVHRVTVVPSEFIDVIEYLKYQRRFRHIKDDADAIDKYRSYAKDQLVRNRIAEENPPTD
ncbi:MAG: thiamine pyrophosphate-dependent enzyme [Chloroflexota bacterium]|nr:thiamine pyrophosphate-dependent enzyme [Chloroflexota bacterium]